MKCIVALSTPLHISAISAQSRSRRLPVEHSTIVGGSLVEDSPIPDNFTPSGRPMAHYRIWPTAEAHQDGLASPVIGVLRSFIPADSPLHTTDW
jgi:hypothetical protein